MKDIAVFGIGGLGREAMAVIRCINRDRPTYNIRGFFDDARPTESLVNGYPYLGTIEEVNAWPTELCLVLAFGYPATKQAVLSKITNPRISYPTIIHPSALISDDRNVSIGRGCIIEACCSLTCNIVIEDFVLLNPDCTIGHDVHIRQFSALMPAVNISGEVLIDEGVYLGTGAKVINQKTIGRWTTIGAGAVVVRDIPAHATAVGVPAKVIKQQ